MLKNAIRGHWDKIILDKSRASPVDCCLPPAGRRQLHSVIEFLFPSINQTSCLHRKFQESMRSELCLKNDPYLDTPEKPLKKCSATLLFLKLHRVYFTPTVYWLFFTLRSNIITSSDAVAFNPKPKMLIAFFPYSFEYIVCSFQPFFACSCIIFFNLPASVRPSTVFTAVITSYS